MSGSNAAAIRRRVTNVLSNQRVVNVPSPTPPTPPTLLPPPVQTRTTPPVHTGQTLQNIISTLETRISVIESSISDNVQLSNSTTPTITDIVEEFSMRFEMFASELVEMKDSIIKLQTYTMDVNKMLLEERIHILSDINPNTQTDTDLDSDVENISKHTLVDVCNLDEVDVNKENDN
jgi:hypothetical protein